MNKLPKVNLCCDNGKMRLYTQYIRVTKENIVATNAHIMCILTTSEIFDEDFIKDSPEIYYIHCTQWKDMLQAKFLNWKDGLIEVVTRTGEKLIRVITEPDFKYPDWEAVIPTERVEEFSNVGIDPKLLYNLYQAMPEGNYCKLQLYKKNRAMLLVDVSNKNKSFGLIMPKLLND